MTSDSSAPHPQSPAAHSQRYAAPCQEPVIATNAVIEVADRAHGARTMAARRPQRELSIKSFVQLAQQCGQEPVSLFKQSVAAAMTSRFCGHDAQPAPQGDRR